MPQLSKQLFNLANPNLNPSQENVTAHATMQGDVFEFKSTNRKSIAPNVGRGIIKDFSNGARRRMLKHFHKINFRDYPAPLFMTLTYPDEVPMPCLAQRNIHRKVMARHLERALGERLPAAWRLEWQDRKSGSRVGEIYPHWHWLIFRHRYIPYVVINDLWKKTIGVNVTTHTHIECVDKRTAIQMYMAKYLTKEACPITLVMAAYQNSIGRQYGWLRKGDIPLHPQSVHSRLPDGPRGDLMRVAAENLPGVSDCLERSFTLYGSAARQAEAIISDKKIDDVD